MPSVDGNELNVMWDKKVQLEMIYVTIEISSFS